MSNSSNASATEGPAPIAAGLKVLVVTIVHDPADARVHRREIGALLDAGAEVTFAAPFRDYGRHHDVRMDGAINLPRAQGRHRLRAIRAARNLLQSKASQFDVVLLHDPELLLAVGTTYRETCVVWDVHEDTAAALGMKKWLPRWSRGIASAGVRWYESWAERRLHLLLAEESYQARFRKTHPIVGNTVPVDPSTPQPVGKDRLVYVGRVTRARGGAEMIELGRRLHPHIRMELYGPVDKDLRIPMEQAQAAGWVRSYGFVPNDEALERIQGALAGVSLLHDQPNYRHSRPTKIMEYMAAGLPVISTPNPSSQDLIDRAQCGALVPFATSAASAAEIATQWSANTASAQDMGNNGRGAAVRSFDWTANGPLFVQQLVDWARSRG